MARPVAPAQRGQLQRISSSTGVPAAGGEFVGTALIGLGNSLFGAHKEIQKIHEREEVIRASEEGKKIALTGDTTIDGVTYPTFQPRPGLGLTQQAYNKAGEAVVTERAYDALLQKRAELLDKYSGSTSIKDIMSGRAKAPDPDKILELWKAYTKGLSQAAPEGIRASMERRSAQLILGSWLKLREQRRRVDEAIRKAREAAAAAARLNQMYHAGRSAAGSYRTTGKGEVPLAGGDDRASAAENAAANDAFSWSVKAAGEQVRGGARTPASGLAYLKKMGEAGLAARASGYFAGAPHDVKVQMIRNLQEQGVINVKMGDEIRPVPVSEGVASKLRKKWTSLVSEMHGLDSRLHTRSVRDQGVWFDRTWRSYRFGDKDQRAAAARAIRTFGTPDQIRRMDNYTEEQRRREQAEEKRRLDAEVFTTNPLYRQATDLIKRTMGEGGAISISRAYGDALNANQISNKVISQMNRWASDLSRNGYVPGRLPGPQLTGKDKDGRLVFDAEKWAQQRIDTVFAAREKLEQEYQLLKPGPGRRLTPTEQRRRRWLRIQIQRGGWLK